MSSDSKKVIQIKPELFKMNKAKTIRTSKKMSAPIDTTKIKEQLTANILKRRKQKLRMESEIEKKKEESEFDKSFNFMVNEKEKEREVKEKNLKRSIKNRSQSNQVLVNVEWPTEMKTDSSEVAPAIWSDKELEEVPIENMSDSMLSYKIDKDINYGCLKGGIKKTFKNLNSIRSHNKTISNRVQFNQALESPSSPSQIPSIVPTYNLIQAPMSTLSEIMPIAPTAVIDTPPITTTPINPMILTPPVATIVPSYIPTTGSVQPATSTGGDIKNVSIQYTIPEPEYIPPPITMTTNPAMVPVELTSELVKNQEKLSKEASVKVPSIKETIKRKTIKHRYTLGKSKTINNRISVLSTSKTRIKQIQDAKRELQKTSIEKMKRYLMDRNLLSSGSAAPSDVIKKMYEESNIAADITNHNDALLLENYLDKV